MPGRLRNTPASKGADDSVASNSAMKSSRLEFRDPLSWRAGRAIPVAELLKSLKKLADELKKYEQDELDVADVAPVAQELAGAHLLAHKDRGVRARAAVCIVDILMLTAPNAPFKVSQLKDIFTTFVTSIIPALADPSNAYNAEHIYVLHSLAEYQSIVLLTDLDSADSLILALFTTCFDIISNSSKASTGEEIVKNVEFDMTRLLATIIDEVPTLPEDVVDIIIVQFLRIDPKTASQIDRKSKRNALMDGKQDTLGLKEYPPAYNMAKALCSNCPEKMTNHISTYFNNIIVDASDSFNTEGLSRHSHKKNANLEDSGDETEDLQQLRKAHKLIRELWRACPEVLYNVIPQLEAELQAESVPLRILATETIGDLAAGIGVAGPPSQTSADPAAWPPMRFGQREALATSNPLTTPLAPKPFSQTHAAAYESFLSRRHDRSPSVRTVWTTAVGRILLTSAGGLGLDSREEENLLGGLASMLSDMEEKIRIAAVKAVGSFGFTDTVNRLATYGSVSKEGSVLYNLADRVKDKKNSVREMAFEVLGRIWGVAAFEIENGSERVVAALSEIPQHILNAYFTNDLEIQLSIDNTIFECLIPFSFPPFKADTSKTPSQRSKASQSEQQPSEAKSNDPDEIRLRRILTLYRDLDEKGRKVFFHLMQRQVKMSQIMTAYLKACEDYNGGIIETDETEVKSRLTKIVDIASRTLPDSSRTSADLWKFARLHDRRNYQLIRYAMLPESDYRTVVRAIKELSKRIQNGPPGTSSLLETLTPLLYRSALLILNRSHIPAVIKVSRTNENGLGAAANEVMKMISNLCPAVLKTHISEMCRDLEANTPSPSRSEDAGSADTLKACAGFARKFPQEIPKDRKLQIALTDYALYSVSPRAAKHAVTILLHTAEKREMYAKDLVSRAVKGFSLTSSHALACLATIAQLSLLAPAAVETENDAIADIALNKVLLFEPHSTGASSTDYVWAEDYSPELAAKEWALRILVNRLRSFLEDKVDQDLPKSRIKDYAGPIYRILNLLITNEGELHKSESTPGSERPHLRLSAAKCMLKLCAHRRACEELVTPQMFNAVALVVQDRLLIVRKGFVDQLKKYLSASRLSARWYTVLLLLAFEPDNTLRSSTNLWLKSQSQNIIRSARSVPSASIKPQSQNVIELLFARLLSLLAHHPDYPTEKESDTYSADLLDFARYILFYLSSVSNEDNLSLIFYIAQRVKQTRDGTSESSEQEDIFSERLYTLSDLSQAVIRLYADKLSTIRHHDKGVNLLQTWPGKLRLPANIFKAFDTHKRELAVAIAEKDFLGGTPKIRDELESVVKSYIKPSTSGKLPKKRKTQEVVTDGEHDSDTGVNKKQKKASAALPIRKASKTSFTSMSKKRKSDESRIKPEEPSRKSSRRSGAGVTYADRDSSEDDREMDRWDTIPNKNKEKRASSRAAGRSSTLAIDDDSNADEMELDSPENDNINGHGPRSGTEEDDIEGAEIADVAVGAESDSELSDVGDEEGTPTPTTSRIKSKSQAETLSSTRRPFRLSKSHSTASPSINSSPIQTSGSKSKARSQKSKANAEAFGPPTHEREPEERNERSPDVNAPAKTGVTKKKSAPLRGRTKDTSKPSKGKAREEAESTEPERDDSVTQATETEPREGPKEGRRSLRRRH